MVSPKQMTIPFPKMDYTFADFFCGCGGLSLGLIQAGLKCISAMDISPDALSTYWYNLCYKTWSHLWVDQNNKKAIKSIQKWTNGGETQNFLFPYGVPDNWLEVPEPMPCLNLFCYSILDMEPEEWMQYCGVRPGDIKIFVGGPPCQGFSTANERRSIYDERNQLPLRYLYYAKIAKPDYVLIENVPGLLSLGKKKGEKEGPFVRWIREAFADAGYDMNYDVHNAADYGVPQNRHRVIFIGTRKGLSKLSFPKGLYGDGPGKIPYIDVMESIGHLPPLEAGETWNEEVCHPYGLNKKNGYVICPRCLQYNKKDRTYCVHCGMSLDNPIKGGVVMVPGWGTLINTEKDVDNSLMRKYKLYGQERKDTGK